jgi:hydroxymethylpyrimidine/phosphomethylpyrimidine kinase
MGPFQGEKPMKDRIPVVLTIAGSDSGGGAGIQADLKTFSALGTFGTTAITAITSQNLQGVRSIQPIDPKIVSDQIDAVCEGFRVRAIKTGMLFSKEIISAVAEEISRFKIENLIVDPVFAATSGSALIEDEGIEALTKELFPLARVITPNIPEAEFLSGLKIEDVARMREALDALIDLYPGPIFILKGGHLPDIALDLYGGNGIGIKELKAQKIDGVNNHGSGCSFASAIAAYIALGHELEESLILAKNFISGSLKNSLMLENDVRLIDHFWRSEKGIH